MNAISKVLVFILVMMFLGCIGYGIYKLVKFIQGDSGSSSASSATANVAIANMCGSGNPYSNAQIAALSSNNVTLVYSMLQTDSNCANVSTYFTANTTTSSYVSGVAMAGGGMASPDQKGGFVMPYNIPLFNQNGGNEDMPSIMSADIRNYSTGNYRKSSYDYEAIPLYSAGGGVDPDIVSAPFAMGSSGYEQINLPNFTNSGGSAFGSFGEAGQTGVGPISTDSGYATFTDEVGRNGAFGTN